MSATSRTNLIAPGLLLIPNKASVIGVVTVHDTEMSVKVVQFASVEAKKVYPAGVLAHYFVFGEDVRVSTGGLLRANFTEAEDAVIFCFKVGGAITYLYGITVEELVAWVPPKKAGEPIIEDGVLHSWKSTHTDIKELVPLTNTENHPHLVATAEKFSCRTCPP